MKKTSSYILPRNISTDFEKNPNIGCRVTGVDGQTDRPTDRRRATAIGPVDLKSVTDADTQMDGRYYQVPTTTPRGSKLWGNRGIQAK